MAKHTTSRGAQGAWGAQGRVKNPPVSETRYSILKDIEREARKAGANARVVYPVKAAKYIDAWGVADAETAATGVEYTPIEYRGKYGIAPFQWFVLSLSLEKAGVSVRQALEMEPAPGEGVKERDKAPGPKGVKAAMKAFWREASRMENPRKKRTEGDDELEDARARIKAQEDLDQEIREVGRVYGEGAQRTATRYVQVYHPTAGQMGEIMRMAKAITQLAGGSGRPAHYAEAQQYRDVASLRKISQGYENRGDGWVLAHDPVAGRNLYGPGSAVARRAEEVLRAMGESNPFLEGVVTSVIGSGIAFAGLREWEKRKGHRITGEEMAEMANPSPEFGYLNDAHMAGVSDGKSSPSAAGSKKKFLAWWREYQLSRPGVGNQQSAYSNYMDGFRRGQKSKGKFGGKRYRLTVKTLDGNSTFYESDDLGEMISKRDQYRGTGMHTAEVFDMLVSPPARQNPGRQPHTHFKSLVREFESRGDVDDPKALAAWIEKRKHGREWPNPNSSPSANTSAYSGGLHAGADYARDVQARKLPAPTFGAIVALYHGWLQVPETTDTGGTGDELFRNFRRGFAEGYLSVVGGRRPNPESTAADLYETFHGRPSTEVIEVEETHHYHEHLTALGSMVELKVRTVTRRDVTITFDGDETQLASNEAGTQLYIIGGDQSLDLKSLGFKGPAADKEEVLVGTIKELTYHTEKKFHKFRPTDYYHKLGEETGEEPELVYDQPNQALKVVGGAYEIRPEGIVN